MLSRVRKERVRRGSFNISLLNNAKHSLTHLHTLSHYFLIPILPALQLTHILEDGAKKVVKGYRERVQPCFRKEQIELGVCLRLLRERQCCRQINIVTISFKSDISPIHMQQKRTKIDLPNHRTHSGFPWSSAPWISKNSTTFSRFLCCIATR